VARDGTPTATYTYDANGNRLAGPGLTATPAYDAQDRLLAYGACSYTYKASGELQAKVCPEGTTTCDYAIGNSRNVVRPNGTRIEYLIDGQNRRIGKKVNGVLVEGFLYRDGLQPVAWLDGTGQICQGNLRGRAAPERAGVHGAGYQHVSSYHGPGRQRANRRQRAHGNDKRVWPPS
jgi:hypothetical protein